MRCPQSTGPIPKLKPRENIPSWPGVWAPPYMGVFPPAPYIGVAEPPYLTMGLEIIFMVLKDVRETNCHTTELDTQIATMKLWPPMAQQSPIFSIVNQSFYKNVFQTHIGVLLLPPYIGVLESPPCIGVFVYIDTPPDPNPTESSPTSITRQRSTLNRDQRLKIKDQRLDNNYFTLQYIGWNYIPGAMHITLDAEDPLL